MQLLFQSLIVLLDLVVLLGQEVVGFLLVVVGLLYYFLEDHLLALQP